jgi:hypothetical protein
MNEHERLARRFRILADIYEQMSRNIALVLAHIDDELKMLDGYPTQCIGAGDLVSQPRTEACQACGGYGCDQCAPQQYSATERAGLARTRLTSDRQQVIEDLGIAEAQASAQTRMYNRILKSRVARPVGHRLCEPTGHQGCMVPREEGGWSDYTCTDLAEKAGLCLRCYSAKRRWLVKMGLPTRQDEAA